MRLLLAAVAFVGLIGLAGCSCTDPYCFSNPGHCGRHLTNLCVKLHEFHVDVDRVLLGIYEETSTPLSLD